MLQDNYLYVALTVWIISGLFIVFEKRLYRIVIYFGIFSLISSVLYLFFSAPDVALAEAGISAFITVFVVIFISKYYENPGNVARDESVPKGKSGKRVLKLLLPISFSAALLALFLYMKPETVIYDYLSIIYLERFMTDVGGENTVAAILLAYRVYDTLFEALVLVVAVVAVLHMSHFAKSEVDEGEQDEVECNNITAYTLRIVCPLLFIFGVYLAMNGHISAGGGFQAGLAVAAFFICRYLICNLYDISVKKVMKLEEMIFISMVVLSILAVFLGVAAVVPAVFLPVFQNVYLVVMNVFIGLKVACAFFILFYRYIAVEGR